MKLAAASVLRRPPSGAAAASKTSAGMRPSSSCAWMPSHVARRSRRNWERGPQRFGTRPQRLRPSQELSMSRGQKTGVSVHFGAHLRHTLAMHSDHFASARGKLSGHPLTRATRAMHPGRALGARNRATLSGHAWPWLAGVRRHPASERPCRKERWLDAFSSNSEP